MAKEGNSDLMTTARNRFKLSVDATTSNRVYQLDDIRFAAASPDNGYQWPQQLLNARQNDPNGARPTLTINKLPQHIRLVTNEQRQNRPSVKVLPVDDTGDIEVAEIFTGIIRHIEVSSNADVAYDTACENQVTCGEGYWRILTDYCDEKSFDQDILFAPIKNPFSVYLDPAGLRLDATGQKCEWGFITQELSPEEFKRQFPNSKEPIDKVEWSDQGYGDDYDTWYEEDQVRIAEYFYTEYKEAKITLWSDGQTTMDDEVPKPDQMGMMPMPVKDRPTQIRSVKWCKLSGLEVLEENDWAGKYIPIIRCVGNEWEVDGVYICSGLVRNAKDAQRMVNYWESQDAEMLALAPKAPFVGAVGQFETMNEEWNQANIKNFSRLEYDPVEVNGVTLPAPQRQQPPMASSAMLAAKESANQNLQATVGQYNPSLGADSQEKSGVAIRARQAQSDVGTFHYIDNLSRAIRYTGLILVDLIPKIYDTKRVIRIIGEDGESDHATIDPSIQGPTQEILPPTGAIEKIYNPNVGRYDVVVTTGPSYTTKRLESAEAMAQVLQGNPELWGVVGDLFVKNMDWPGAQEMAERIKKTIPANLLESEDDGQTVQTPDGPLPIAQVPQALAALQQQIQQMGELLEKADVMKVQNQSKEVEIKAQDNQVKMMDAQTKRFQAETDRMLAVADIKKKQSEIQLNDARADQIDHTKVTDIMNINDNREARREEKSNGSN